MKQGLRTECLFLYYPTTDMLFLIVGFELIKGSTIIWELYQILRLLNCFSHTMARRKNISKKRSEKYHMRHCFDEHAYTRWCIFRPTHIRHTLLLTCAKSAILARGFLAAIWTCGRSARRPSRGPWPVLAIALGP